VTMTLRHPHMHAHSRIQVIFRACAANRSTYALHVSTTARSCLRRAR
jgi:hypothetical protein